MTICFSTFFFHEILIVFLARLLDKISKCGLLEMEVDIRWFSLLFSSFCDQGDESGGRGCE